MSGQTVVLDPTGSKASAFQKLAPRLRTLNGARIGFLCNRKPNADILLDQVATRLAERFVLGARTHLTKHTPTGPASPEIYDQLQHADLVIVALNDCGGCAGWSVHDAIELERRGVPTVSFVTDHYVALSSAQARTQGIKSLPMVRLQHFFGQVSADEARSRTDELIDQLVQLAIADDATGNGSQTSEASAAPARALAAV